MAFEELMQRLTGRRTCNDCGAIYNVHLSPPKTADHCDACNGELFQRADDNEEVVQSRLNIYHEQTEPLVKYYDKKGVLVSIDGLGTPDEVFAKIKTALDQ